MVASPTHQLRLAFCMYWDVPNRAGAVACVGHLQHGRGLKSEALWRARDERYADQVTPV